MGIWRRLVVFWSACVLLATGSGSAAAAGLSVALAEGPVSLVFYVAQANGYFDSEGVAVTTRSCSSGRDCYRLMADGSVQLATAAELVATINSFTRPDLAFIASISSSANQIKVVARRSAGVSAPASLAGKRIGTVVGSSAEYFLDSWLLFHNLSARNQTIVPMTPDKMVRALQQGDIDAAAIWEPVATNALVALGADGLLLPAPRVYTQHFGLLTTRAMLDAQQADLLKLLQALLRAERWIAEQPVKAQQVLMARLGLSQAVAEAHLREHDFRIRMDQSLSNTMDSQARWAVREGHVPARSKPEDLLSVTEPALLRKLAPNAVTIVR